MVTLIDTENGVTVFEGSSGSLKLIHWTVTDNESEDLGYTLEEAYEVRCSLAFWLHDRLCGWGNLAKTRTLQIFLNSVATGEIAVPCGVFCEG